MHESNSGVRSAIVGTLTTVALGFALTACTAASGQSAASNAPPIEDKVVAIGDSIPFNSNEDCPGCDGFVDTYTGALTEARGEPYVAHNYSRHDGATTADILKQVEGGALDEILTDAAIVIISAGYNDAAPYDAGACHDRAIDLDTVAGAATALAGTTPECIEEHVTTVGHRLRGVLERVRELAPEASILALTEYNAWTGWADLDAAGPETEAIVTKTVAASLLAWRDVVCEEAAAVGGNCVDVMAAFNGPDATSPSGELLAADYNHPSQAGNDRIRDLLLEVEG